jgi:hypothetical protein
MKQLLFASPEDIFRNKIALFGRQGLSSERGQQRSAE